MTGTHEIQWRLVYVNDEQEGFSEDALADDEGNVFH
jgi:hypothetical protein